METHRLSRNLSIIDVAPPIAGFEEFLTTYVLEAGKIALIDVGPSVSVENLVLGLRQLKVNPAAISYVLATHIHLDHTGGVGQAIKYMPNARVVVHEKGAPHLVAPARLWEGSQQALGELASKYGPLEPVAPDKIIVAKSGMLFDLGGKEIEVLETPGHASHHLSFLDRKEGRLFAGEMAGVYVREVDLIRPSTPPPFNLEHALTSLDKAIALHPRFLCYAHFGCTTKAVDRLRYEKEQLILWGKIIAECLEDKASNEETLDEIRKKDAILARVDKLPPDQRDRELYFINNSISGYIGYFQRYGTEYLKQL